MAIEAPVLFSSNGVVTAGLAHAAGTAGISVTSAGDYLITFTVDGVQPGQFALFANGAPITNTVYGSALGSNADSGQAIETLGAGTTLTLVNHSSPAAVTLQTLDGGTQTNVNASIVIERLS